jgi:hypothetical protein
MKEKKDDSAPEFADAETNAMLQKIYEMNGKIRDEVDKITAQAGITRNELYSYFENPKYFNETQLKKIEEDQTLLEKKLLPILGPKWKERRATLEKKKLLKKRKGKVLGGRKKWISMR